MEDLIQEEEGNISTAGDQAKTNDGLSKGKSEKKKKDDYDKEMEESYKTYEERDTFVFELLKRSDFDDFQMGYRKANVRYWRRNAVLFEMTKHMNARRTRNFVVKYQDTVMSPWSSKF